MLTSLSCRVLFPESTAFMLRASSILSFNHPPLTFVCDPQATTTDESNEKQHKKIKTKSTSYRKLGEAEKSKQRQAQTEIVQPGNNDPLLNSQNESQNTFKSCQFELVLDRINISLVLSEIWNLATVSDNPVRYQAANLIFPLVHQEATFAEKLHLERILNLHKQQLIPVRSRKRWRDLHHRSTYWFPFIPLIFIQMIGHSLIRVNIGW